MSTNKITNPLAINKVESSINNTINSLYGKGTASAAAKATPAFVVESKATAVSTTSNAPVAKINTIDADEAFARMLQEQDDADFARALQAIEEQEANDAAIAKLLQADDDEAFARMLQEQDEADFAFALSLQFEEADMLGASASCVGLGSLGQDYYSAFYAA